MTRPGVVVSSATAPPPLGVPTDTGVAFICAEALMGPVAAPTRLTSIDQFVANYGQRLAAAPLGYDAVDTALHEGAGAVYFMRLADTATAAKADAKAVAGEGAEAVAANPGAWGNTLELVVASASGGNFTGQVKLGGAVVQSTLPVATVTALSESLATGPYMRIVKAAKPAEAPKAGTVTLAGGTDGKVPITSTKVLPEALALIPASLGPGQVLAPGKSDAESHTALLAHAAGTATAGVNRIALLDGTVEDTETTLKAQAAALRGTVQDRYGALWAPWATIPGLAPGTSRSVPWSAIQAGICSRNDAAGNPNQAGAGPWGVSRYATGLLTAFTDPEREALLLAGVNTARSVYGTIESYSFRTLVDPAGVRAPWLQLNHARTNMAIVAKADAVGEEIIFSQLDGRGHTIAKFNGMLAGMLKELYDEGALYGDEPTEAFTVNTGPAVNTPATLAEGTLKAVLAVRMSPHGELISIEVVKVPITVALAA